LFWQLQYYGCCDPRFGYEQFGDQPDWLIFQALEFFGRHRRAEINTVSQIHSIGWTGLFNGFSSESARKLEPDDLLPFPDQTYKRRVSDRTARILAMLISENRMPLRVAGAVRQLEEVAELLDDDNDGQ
jgi:hypothetical protein